MKKPFSLGIIPARGGSKGIPRKNIRPLNGKPLLLYTIDAAINSELLSYSVVSTEDTEIAAVARNYGCQVVNRPVNLALDSTPSLPVVQHAVHVVEDAIGFPVDYVLVLQATTPFRTHDDIDRVIEKMTVSSADSVVSVARLEEFHPWKIKKIQNDKLEPYLDIEVEGVRRQDLPPAYVRNGGIYAVKRSVLMNENSLYGSDCRAYVMPRERSVDINDEFDLWVAETIIAKKMV